MQQTKVYRVLPSFRRAVFQEGRPWRQFLFRRRAYRVYLVLLGFSQVLAPKDETQMINAPFISTIKSNDLNWYY